MSKERLFGLFLLVLCSALWFWIIPGQTAGPKEAFMPRLTVLFMAIPALALLLPQARTSRQAATPPAFRIFFRATLPTIALFLLFIIAAGHLGFFVSGAIFATAAMALYGERRWTMLAAVPLLLLGSVWFFVVFALKFELPGGLLF